MNKCNIDFRYGNINDFYDHFTIKNLDTINDYNNINCKTKSHILAPFNSSYKISKSLDSQLQSIQVENNIIKLAMPVKEPNRQYEINFNGECDNGIIINDFQNEIILYNDSNSDNLDLKLNNSEQSEYNANQVKDKNTNKNIDKDIKDNKDNNSVIFNSPPLSPPCEIDSKMKVVNSDKKRINSVKKSPIGENFRVNTSNDTIIIGILIITNYLTN